MYVDPAHTALFPKKFSLQFEKHLYSMAANSLHQTSLYIVFTIEHAL